MINKEELLKHFDNDSEMISELVSIFIESYPETLQALENAIKALDFPNIELHAHTLKGMIANFFADDLKVLAFELEKLGRESSAEDLEGKFSKLSTGLEAMMGELEAF